MKTQLCTKYEKRFADAKAGQTLACFSHVVLNRFAAPTRYIEKKISQAMPKKFYVHQKKNFDCLEEWVVDNNFSSFCLESDYEAFDSSQDCLILAFEYELLKYLGWDQGLLDDYLDLKFNLGCRLGNLAVMRFTGEFGTFLFNTLANMVFTFMSYDLDGSEAICFAGDDMCCNRGIRKRSDGRFDHILSRLTLKAKAMITKEPTFCGWRLTKFGIFKKPELVLERFLIAIEKGRLHDVIDSYYLECSYAYKLGERLFEVFSEKDFSAHYCCIRIVHENRKLLKGLSLEKYKSNLRYGHSCSSPRETSSSRNSIVVTRMSAASELRKFIQTEGTHQTKKLIQSRSQKVPSQSSQSTVTEAFFEVYQLSIQESLLKRGTKESSRESTLEPLSLASTNLATMKERLQEANAFLLMVDEEGKVQSSSLFLLTFQMGLPTFYLLQMQFLTLKMTYSAKHVSFSSFSKMSIIWQDLIHLPLKLALFIDSPTHSIASTKWESLEERAQLEAHIKRYMVQDAWMNQEREPYSRICCQLGTEGSSQKLELKRLQNSEKAREAPLGLGEKEALPSTETIMLSVMDHKLRKENAGLGQARVTLMNEEFLKAFWIVRLALPLRLDGVYRRSQKAAMGDAQENAALRAWINETTGFPGAAYGLKMRFVRRRILLRQHWVQTLKQHFQNLGHANDPHNFTEAELIIYNSAVNDFAAYAFGILAEEGFSPATIYSDFETEYTITYPNPVGQKTVTFNPAEVARSFKYYSTQSALPVFNGITWRQVGECFAPDIVTYFRTLQPDAQSWLVRSNPVLAGDAPWVALDVTDGLEMRHLTPEEKKVVTRAKNHLLKSMQLKNKESVAAEAYLES